MKSEVTKMAKKSAKSKKQCSKCKKWTEKKEFYKCKGHTDGLESWCKECMRKASKQNYARGEGFVRKRRIYEKIHRVVNGMKQKQCNKCKEWKNESGFYGNNGHKDGLASWCKACCDKAATKCMRRRRAVMSGVREQKLSA